MNTITPRLRWEERVVLFYFRAQERKEAGSPPDEHDRCVKAHVSEDLSRAVSGGWADWAEDLRTRGLVDGTPTRLTDAGRSAIEAMLVEGRSAIDAMVEERAAKPTKPTKPMTKRDVEELYAKHMKVVASDLSSKIARDTLEWMSPSRVTIPLGEGVEVEIDPSNLARFGADFSARQATSGPRSGSKRGASQGEASGEISVVCWLMDRRTESEHVVTVDSEEDLDVIADNYAAKHCRCQEGDIVFVETERGVIWRVECVSGRPLVVLLTAMCTREEALEEIESESLEVS